ncbi:MAG: class I SAM-dependent methyltransferase [Nitrospirae bacterium]|nr:class I SAM-dependent methyltransferase [Nitrospirota bacterium]
MKQLIQLETPRMKFSHFYPLLGFLVPTAAIGYGVVIPQSCIAGWHEQSIGFGLALTGASIAYWQGIWLALRGRKPMRKTMRRPEFIAKQSRCPSGLFGLLLARIMATETYRENMAALQLMNLQPEDKVLEIGCGHGRTIAQAVAKTPQGFVAGLDISETMVQMATRHNRRWIKEGRVEIKHGNSISIPYPDCYFDRVFSVHTIYFWSNPINDLREIKRVMKKDSCLILGFKPKEEKVAAEFPSSIYKFYSTDEVVLIMETAGYEHVQIIDSPASARNVLFAIAHPRQDRS